MNEKWHDLSYIEFPTFHQYIKALELIFDELFIRVNIWRSLNDFFRDNKEDQITSEMEQMFTLINNASITPSLTGDISKKLDANFYIYGSVEKSGEKLRISAQLVDSKTKEPFKSVQVEGPYRNELDLKIIDSLRTKIRDFLVISVLEKKVYSSLRSYILTNSAEA